jgi:uncharacterized protein (TIGR03067 family)
MNSKPASSKKTFRLTIASAAIALLAIAVVARAAELSKQQNLSELDGTWKLVTATMSGQSLLSGDQQRPEITIKDGVLTSDFKRAASELPLDLNKVVDPLKSPKLITLPLLRRIMFYGIYEVRDAQLRIAGGISRGRNSGEPRPTDFTDNQGVQLVFQRAP